MYGHKSSLFWRGRINYADGQSSQSSRGLSCRGTNQYFFKNFCGLFSYCFVKNKGNLSIFHHFSIKQKFELFRRFHKPFTQMARFLGKRSIDMVYTTKKRLFWFLTESLKVEKSAISQNDLWHSFLFSHKLIRRRILHSNHWINSICLNNFNC